MLNFKVVIKIALMAFLNVSTVSSTLSEIIHLLKTVDGERIECTYSITNSGLFTFTADPKSTGIECQVSIIVPAESMALVKPAETTCETTRNANFSMLCEQPNREGQYSHGEHHFRFDVSESVTISVEILPIIRLGCDEYAKNLFDLLSGVITLGNDGNTRLCMIQLPAALEIEYIHYEMGSRKKSCCPDIFTVSTDEDENAVVYDAPINACDIQAKRPRVSTRCARTFMYFRNAGKRDEITFRIRSRHKNYIEDCESYPNELNDMSEYVCNKKPKKKVRTRSTF